MIDKSQVLLYMLLTGQKAIHIENETKNSIVSGQNAMTTYCYKQKI